MAWSALVSSDLESAAHFIRDHDHEVGHSISRLPGGISKFLNDAKEHGRIYLLRSHDAVQGIIVTTIGSLDRSFLDRDTAHISLIILHPERRSGRNFLNAYLAAGHFAIKAGVEYVEFKALKQNQKTIRLYGKFSNIDGEAINMLGDAAVLFKTPVEQFVSRLQKYSRKPAPLTARD